MHQVWENRPWIQRVHPGMGYWDEGDQERSQEGNRAGRQNRGGRRLRFGMLGLGKRLRSNATACISTRFGHVQTIECLAISSPNQFIATLYTKAGKAEKVTTALVDSGASRNFINRKLVGEWGLPLITLENPKQVRTIDGSDIKSGKIWHRVELPIRIGSHQHTSSFLVCKLGEHPMVSGLCWLAKHNPTIDWESKELLFQSDFCKENCIPKTLHSAMEEPYEPLTEPLKEQIPEPYHEFLTVVGEEEFKALPPHRPYDIGIDLTEGAKLPMGPIYSMTPGESKSLRTYLDEELARGKIRTTKSPGGAPVMFVKKADGSLRLVVDYQKLNEVTIKDRHPLPRQDDLMEKLQRAKVFTKFDLRWGYNNIRVREGDEFKQRSGPNTEASNTS